MSVSSVKLDDFPSHQSGGNRQFREHQFAESPNDSVQPQPLPLGTPSAVPDRPGAAAAPAVAPLRVPAVPTAAISLLTVTAPSAVATPPAVADPPAVAASSAAGTPGAGATPPAVPDPLVAATASTVAPLWVAGIPLAAATLPAVAIPGHSRPTGRCHCVDRCSVVGRCVELRRSNCYPRLNQAKQTTASSAFLPSPQGQELCCCHDQRQESLPWPLRFS